MQTFVEVGPALAVALVLLVVLAVAVGRYGDLGQGRATVVAALRACVQLALVALVLETIVDTLGLSALFVLFMFVVATLTAANRLGQTRHTAWCAVPIGLGALPVVGLLLALGVVPTEGVPVIAVSGILIGGAMTAQAVAGRRALDDLYRRKGEVEAALALGLVDRDAALLIARPAAAQALIPGMDQTRTVGLVTLPGAFVGSLLGGATPVEAGGVQVLILVALLAVQSVAVVVTVELVARGTVHAEPSRPIKP